MECKKVRDLFSSLLEGDLKPPEDERIREHLRSCEGCQKEWEQFSRMMSWLHKSEEEEVPEGFLSEIQKKRGERKGKEIRSGTWFLRSAKIPLQAAAMVMIVFLALYLTKMAPFETVQKRAVEKPQVTESDREKEEPVLKEEERQKKVSPPLADYRKDYVSEAQSTVEDEKVRARDNVVQKMKEADQEAPAPHLKREMAAGEPVRTKEIAKAEDPRFEEKKREPESTGAVRMSLAKKTAREITLKISDWEKAFAQVQELAKRMGGEVVKEEGDVLLASLPASTYAEFEKELAQIGFPPATPKPTVPKEMKDDLKLAAEAKSKEQEEKGRELSRPTAMRETLISIRIRLILE
ncbi:MAG: hypothetical protein FJ115_14815 [Deltaproteobacteria bacterium]|nr:hypothetical protein [Deltaproteobacteria bacterium]MBM4324829.1 hypothetical protein [Deltaproteobacteria bacterium]